MKKVSTISKISIFLIFLSSVLYFGCKKDRIQDPKLNAYDSPDSYLDSKKVEEQEFTIDSSGTGPVIGKQGTKIWPGKICLMYAADSTDITFPFILKLVELYKPKDMIYYRMPTVAAGNILRTDGEIRLRAFKNTQELILKDSCSMPVEMPNSAPRTDMKVFYGFESGGLPDWTDQPAGVFTKTAYGYSAQVKKLGWVNCDVRADSAVSYTVSFASTVDDLTNIRFFIYIPKTKTVMVVYNTTSFNIPSGADIKIIGIGMQGSDIFHFYSEVKLTSSATVDVEMKPISDPGFTALLDGL